jgi:hypothetical protein
VVVLRWAQADPASHAARGIAGREDELGGTVGVGGVDLRRVVGEDDRVDGMQALAFGDGDDLAVSATVRRGNR